MVDIANLMLLEEKKPMTFKEAFDKVAALKNWDEEQKQEKISQFYTDLNLDGRFITNGENTWGLKRWYRVDQMNKEFATAQMDEEDTAEHDGDIELEDFMADELQANDNYDDIAQYDSDFVGDGDV